MEQRRVLREREAAQYLAVSVSMLQKFRTRGGGPAFIRLGRRSVGYDVVDLDQWILGQKRTSTSDIGWKGGERPTRAPAAPAARPRAALTASDLARDAS